MKKFIKNSLIFSIIPLLFFLFSIISFVVIDPFMIFGANKGKPGIHQGYEIALHRDFQALELFMKNYDSMSYASFILGNSRSFFYDVDTWKKYIKGQPFHLNSSGESLYGIERKLDFLNNRKVDIKNVLLVLDVSILATTTDTQEHLFIKHPMLSGNYYVFYKTMFFGFFPKAMYAHLDLFVTKEKKKYMDGFGIVKNTWKLDPVSNQYTYHLYDSILENNIEEYYKKASFYERESIQTYSKEVIKDKQKELLLNIKYILKSQKTNYKIIINPLYDQKKINKHDLNYLQNLFGEENVYDFSGINKYTESKYNYYETSHYRPHIADSIMKTIYSK